MFSQEKRLCRSPGAFDEQAYRQLYPDVASAVSAGAFSSGLQHYIRYGQFEANRIGVFAGSNGNDTITGFGKRADLIGIGIQSYVRDASGKLDFNYTSLGTGEVDTLIGKAKRDLFYLGAPEDSLRLPIRFYEGSGNADYALIKNFQRGSDAIGLAGYSTTGYNLLAVNGNLNISSLSGDLIATVEGVTSLSQIPFSASLGSFQIG